MARDTWPRLCSARVYEFTPKDVLDIIYSFEGQVIDVLPSVDKAPSKTTTTTTKTLIELLRWATLQRKDNPEFSEEILRVMAVHEPEVWEHLPFEHVWFGYGPGITIPNEFLWSYGLPDSAGGGYRVVGSLLSRDGSVEEYLCRTEPDGKINTWCHLQMRSPESGWSEPLCASRFVIQELVRKINDNRVIVSHVRGFKHRNLWKKHQKKLRFKRKMPPPYYRLAVSPQYVTREEIGHSTKDVLWSHRWDVEAHDRYYIKRGSLPIDPDQELSLTTPTKAGNAYQIWKTGEPPSWVNRALAERHLHPKRVGEWIAVMRIRVPATVKGPKDKPYIPASRRCL